MVHKVIHQQRVNLTEAFPTSSTAYPDVEDINKDQTMNPVSSYFEYEVSLNKSDLQLRSKSYYRCKK